MLDVNPPTKNEIDRTFRRIKNDETAGTDSIPVETLKSDIYLLLRNFGERMIANKLKEEISHKIPKKRGLGGFKNYRRIT